MSVPVLEMKKISKSFYGTQVLKDIDLRVNAGEIHCLVGENGAGKSTLMNILFGMSVITDTGGYEGDLLVNGDHVAFDSPKAAIGAGIGMVHQEFMLLPGFTVTENIKLNRESTKPNLFSRVLGKKLETLDRKQMAADAKAALDKLGMNIEEWVTVAGLPVGYLQFVEIAREIDKQNLQLLVLDEPTAVLTESEAEQFLDVVRRLAKSGISILFITHRLDEVMAVADAITILKDGELVQSGPTQEFTIAQIAELMVGRKVDTSARLGAEQAREGKKKVLEIRDLRVDMPGERLRGIDLDVYEGEILGIGGLAGHGKIALANGIMGLYPSRGQVRYEGTEVPLNNPRKALDLGLAFVSEDRRGVGLVLEDSIANNIVLTSMQTQDKFLKPGPLKLKDQKQITAHALESIKRFDIRCTGPDQIVRRLSGGNQQKVCLARAFTQNPRLFFVSEPTRGIDVGAKSRVLELIVELNRMGVTVVITSSELAELRSISDRIAIIYEGRLSGILPPDAPDVEYGLLMAGKSLEEVEIGERPSK
ncbi:MAG: sugar ABC transporter ATP-binding protein [Bacillota bacterium]|jgi:simple sugar transport system ATP-binding protein|nr:sugar ABC transporter ATP-binding protein [Bacillota bacterium]HHT90367.1 sugar ABC transporter ATP-binding protein [Bacillota bacterium]